MKRQSGKTKFHPESVEYLNEVFKDCSSTKANAVVAMDYVSLFEGCIAAHKEYQNSEERKKLTERVRSSSAQNYPKAMASLKEKTFKEPKEHELPLVETLDLKLTTVANLGWKNMHHLHEMYQDIWMQEFRLWEEKCARLLAKVYHLGQKKLKEMHLEETSQRIQKAQLETETLRGIRSGLTEESLDRAFTLRSDRMKGLSLHHAGQKVYLDRADLSNR